MPAFVDIGRPELTKFDVEPVFAVLSIIRSGSLEDCLRYIVPAPPKPAFEVDEPPYAVRDMFVESVL